MVSALGAGEGRDGHTFPYAKASLLPGPNKRLELDMMWMQMDRSVVGCSERRLTYFIYPQEGVRMTLPYSYRLW